MSDETVVAIARIPLARSPARMLAGPALLLLLAVATAVAGWLLLDSFARIGAFAVAGLVALLAVYLAARALSVSLEVEVSTLRVRRLGTDLRFTLVRGAVTRVSLTGEGAARLRPRFGPFGWGVGSATLRGEETIHLVRLAPVRSLILVPSDAGRVGIAAASEEQLLAALSAAARVQQRLDQVAVRARSLPLDRLVEEAPRPAPPPTREPEPERVLTGIERVLLEERLAVERAAALAAAEAERRRAEEDAAAVAAMRADRETAPPATVERGPRPRIALPRPSLPRPSFPRPRISLPAIGPLPQELAGRYLVVVLPLLLATVVWAYATVSGNLDLPEERARQVGLTLALVGPGAALGALVARAWFPRLLGLVTVTSVCALILAGRALLA
jgi:hypothetical protein